LINSLSSGFSCCRSDPNLDVKHVNGDIFLLVLYMNNLVFTRSSHDMVVVIKNKLMSITKSLFGCLRYFLGIKVLQLDDVIVIS
jgi:hypothetical protein